MSDAATTGRAIVWDFDGTLAERPGMWSACLIEVLDEYEPGHAVAAEAVGEFLRSGFPWHSSDVAHAELATPDSWWEPVFGVLARAFEGVGYPAERAGELARLVRERYVDPETGWRLFDDALPVLLRLRERGWRHVILSNHVPELEAIVSRLGVGDVVHAVVNSAVTGYEKPHPRAFELAREAADGADVLWMVGDSVAADVEGAEAAGIPAILVHSDDAGTVARSARTLTEAAEMIGW